MAFSIKHSHAVFGGIWLDASLEELHISDSEVTTHPVEEGSDITDHVRPKADAIRLTGVVSNQPIETPGSHADGARPVTLSREFELGPPGAISGVTGGGLVGGALASAVGDLLGLNRGAVVAQGFDQGFDRVADAYLELLAIKNEGRLFEISTTLRTYEQMVMRQLEVRRDAENGQWLRFSAVCEQLRIVATALGDIPEPKVERAKTEQTKAKTPTKDAGGAGALAQSTLSAITGG